MDNSQDQSNALRNQNASGAEASPPSDARSVATAWLLAVSRLLGGARGVRRIPDVTPVAVIDLTNSDRPATNRAPDAVIDLCTPERSQSVGPTSLGRRRHSSDSTSGAGNDDGPTPPKRECPNCEQKEDPYKCPVCLERVRMRQPVSTNCGHVFCKDCIIAAIRTLHKCPLCNKELTMREFNRIYL